MQAGTMKKNNAVDRSLPEWINQALQTLMETSGLIGRIATDVEPGDEDQPYIQLTNGKQHWDYQVSVRDGLTESGVGALEGEL